MSIEKLYTFEKDCYAVVINWVTNPTDLIIKITDEVKFESEKVIINNKTVVLPRLTASYTCDDNCDFPDFLQEIAKQLNNIKLQIAPNSSDVNYCHFNYYRNNKDYTGWDTVNMCPVYNIIVGEERILEIRKKTEPDLITQIAFKNGYLIIMYGKNFTDNYQYRILKSDSVIKSSIHMIFK